MSMKMFKCFKKSDEEYYRNLFSIEFIFEFCIIELWKLEFEKFLKGA